MNRGGGPREKDVEITELDGGSLAMVVTVSFGILGVLLCLVYGFLLLLEIRVPIPGITLQDAWYLVPLDAILLLVGTYLFVRCLCFSYNKVAGRTGGIVLRIRE